MLQLTRTSFGSEPAVDEDEKFIEMSVENSDSESDSFMEELTTVNYEIKTEVNPPIVTPPTSVLETSTLSNPSLMKLVAYEPTEATVEVQTEVTVEANEPAQEDQMEANSKKSKSLKPRPNIETEEIFVQAEPRLFETVEDTTPSIDLENPAANDTSFDEDETTIQPPTSKKPKKIEIFKTRPNELLRHYVEDSHLRSPVAALIDKKRNPLSKAKKLWKAALKPNSLLDIMVVSYDSEGE